VRFLLPVGVAGRRGRADQPNNEREGEMSEADELLPTEEAAAVLGVTGQTLRKYEADGLIASKRTPGGHRRFRMGDLVALRDGEAPAVTVEVS
jgi:excisionase family DNA binding protein